jgi:hypothetical protein
MLIRSDPDPDLQYYSNKLSTGTITVTYEKGSLLQFAYFLVHIRYNIMQPFDIIYCNRSDPDSV